MTFEEKVQLIAGNCKVYESMGIGSYNSKPYGAGGCERLGVPEMKFCDGPRGCVSGNSTCFPVTMARGATFDPELEERVGSAIGEEIRARIPVILSVEPAPVAHVDAKGVRARTWSLNGVKYLLVVNTDQEKSVKARVTGLKAFRASTEFGAVPQVKDGELLLDLPKLGVSFATFK